VDLSKEEDVSSDSIMVELEPGQNIVINPPEDVEERFWLAKIISKKGNNLRIKWFEKVPGFEDRYTSLSTSDEIPIESIFDDIKPILKLIGAKTFVLENNQKIFDHISSAYS